jgi:hypothetical protein
MPKSVFSRYRDRRRFVVQADNAKPSVGKRIKQILDNHNPITVPHPPYFPDLAPSNLFLFGYVNRVLLGANSPTVEGLFEVAIQVLSQIPLQLFMNTFHE